MERLRFLVRFRRGTPSSFVEDGYLRAYEANEPRIRLQVEEEFAIHLSNASIWRQFLLRRRIELEITRRMDTVAPPNALY